MHRITFFAVLIFQMKNVKEMCENLKKIKKRNEMQGPRGALNLGSDGGARTATQNVTEKGGHSAVRRPKKVGVKW